MAIIIKRTTKKHVDEQKQLNDKVDNIQKTTKAATDSIDKINRTLINVLR